MALDKEQAQGVIDDFVFSNDTELQKIAGENKALFNATINALDFLSKKFGTGQEISKERVLQMVEVVKEDELPFKVGDKFKNQDGRIIEIKDAIEPENGDNGYNIEVDGYLPYGGLSTNDIIDKIESKKWVKFEEEKPIRKFNVGDKFNVNKTILNFTIDHITDSDVGVIYDDGLTAIVKIDQFADGIISGYYKPIPKTKSTDLHIGDLIVDTRNTRVYEVEEIDNITKMVKFRKDTGGSAVKWTPFSVFDNDIKNGTLKMLSFKIGDSFETPTREIKQIKMRDGIVFYVSTNLGTLKSVLYNVIQDRIESGEWTKLAFSEPKSITTPDLSQAQPNATQQMMAQATATPIFTASGTSNISAKLPKKTLSKDEKAIKILQKEIDGLELIAEFDEEAKTELEKKQAEIKALKSKIS